MTMMSKYLTTEYKPLPPRRGRNSSARGKEYRARKKRYEADLKMRVRTLHEEVTTLQMTCALRNSQKLQSFYCDAGSLAKMLREYFNMFRFGLYDTRWMDMAPDFIVDKINRQEQFLKAIMDENANIGGKIGPHGAMQQWRLYTLVNDSIRVEVERMEVIHSGGDTMIKVFVDSHCRIGYNTFQLMAPNALHNPELIKKFIHREVVYKLVFHIRFTEEGLIASEEVDINAVRAWLEAGIPISDIAEFMKLRVDAREIPQVVESSETPEVVSIESVDEPLECSHAQKLSLKYLLSDEVDNV